VPIKLEEDVLRRINIFDHRLGQEIDGATIGPQFKGYIFRLKGGSDKDGFPMVQGVLANSRVSLLLARGATGFNTFRGRSGERRRKNIRGCIVGPDIAMLNLVVVKIGDAPIDGLTNKQLPRRLGPKRASKIRKLFGLKDEDVRKYVVRRKVDKAGKKTRVKAPRVQRLITAVVRARRLKKIKERQASLRKSQAQRKRYVQVLTRNRMASRMRKMALLRRQREGRNIRDIIAHQKATSKGGKGGASKKAAAAKPAAKKAAAAAPKPAAKKVAAAKK